MAENPALEWNVLDGTRNQLEHPVTVKPIITRCSIRATYAPFIVSMDNRCIVAGQAPEVNISSDLNLLIDLSQLQYYNQWATLMLQMAASLNRSQDNRGAQDEADNHRCLPTNVFVTSNTIRATVYEQVQHYPLPCVYVSVIQPHVLFRRDERDQVFRGISFYDLKIRLPKWNTKDSLLATDCVPNKTHYFSDLIETRAGHPSLKAGIPPSFLTVTLEQCDREMSFDFGRPMKLVANQANFKTGQYLLKRSASLYGTRETASQEGDLHDAVQKRLPFRYDGVRLKTSQLVLEMPFNCRRANDDNNKDEQVVVVGGLGCLEIIYGIDPWNIGCDVQLL